ncbi:hypothetical protein, partial [Agromyces humi]|uniref:hypothetical protein n=1 Tax=Agromyces humi TaxID=1766800 RepID=UPI00193A0CFA
FNVKDLADLPPVDELRVPVVDVEERHFGSTRRGNGGILDSPAATRWRNCDPTPSPTRRLALRWPTCRAASTGTAPT